MLLGVADKPPWRVVGTQALLDPVALANRLFTALEFRIDVDEVAHPDGRVLVFRIPSRPRGTAYHFKGKYLMRSGASLVPMSEDKLRAIFAEGKPDWLEEHSKTGLSGSQVVELLDTQAFFELLKVPYPTDLRGVIERLLAERLIGDVGGKYAVRHLGALLLAKRLDEFADLARKAPGAVVCSATSKLVTRLDQVGAKGYAVGFQGLVGFVSAQLAQNEVIEDALRKEVNQAR